MARVYHLKRATNQAKYRHMNAVLDFRANLKDRQASGMTQGTRDFMLIEIKRMMGGGTAKYHAWFDRVYQFRKADDMPTYEKKIKQKYYYLRRRERMNKSAPLPRTEGMSAGEQSAALSDWLSQNWDRIPEVSL